MCKLWWKNFSILPCWEKFDIMKKILLSKNAEFKKQLRNKKCVFFFCWKFTFHIFKQIVAALIILNFKNKFLRISKEDRHLNKIRKEILNIWIWSKTIKFSRKNVFFLYRLDSIKNVIFKYFVNKFLNTYRV